MGGLVGPGRIRGNGTGASDYPRCCARILKITITIIIISPEEIGSVSYFLWLRYDRKKITGGENLDPGGAWREGWLVPEGYGGMERVLRIIPGVALGS